LPLLLLLLLVVVLVTQPRASKHFFSRDVFWCRRYQHALLDFSRTVLSTPMQLPQPAICDHWVMIEGSLRNGDIFCFSKVLEERFDANGNTIPEKAEKLTLTLS